MIYFWYIVAGVVAGIFGGLGMGGGTLLIPILTIFLSFEQKLAQGINLLSFLVVAIVSIIIHFKNGYIKTRHISIIILSGMVFSIAGAMLSSVLPSKVLRIIFGVFLCILALVELFKIIFAKKK